MSQEPLVRIGQGDNARDITEADVSKGTPWQALFALWLAFAVLAWLWDLASKGGR